MVLSKEGKLYANDRKGSEGELELLMCRMSGFFCQHKALSNINCQPSSAQTNYPTTIQAPKERGTKINI